MKQNVSIVIVSHSKAIADGAAQMARQMVGDEVDIFPTGGNIDGGLGTDVTSIYECLQSAYSDKGVLVMVDLGGAETNAEMAIEMCTKAQQQNIRLSDGAVVEGSIMAATEASSGADLQLVKETSEEFK